MFLIASNTADLRGIVGHARDHGSAVEVRLRHDWQDGVLTTCSGCTAPAELVATSVFWPHHGTRLASGNTPYRNQYLLVRCGRSFGACAFEAPPSPVCSTSSRARRSLVAAVRDRGGICLPCDLKLLVAADTGHRYADTVFARHQEAPPLADLVPVPVSTVDERSLPWSRMGRGRAPAP